MKRLILLRHISDGEPREHLVFSTPEGRPRLSCRCGSYRAETSCGPPSGRRQSRGLQEIPAEWDKSNELLAIVRSHLLPEYRLECIRLCVEDIRNYSNNMEEGRLTFAHVMEGLMMLSTFWAQPPLLLEHPGKWVWQENSGRWQIMCSLDRSWYNKDDENVVAARIREAQKGLITWRSGSLASVLELEFGIFEDRERGKMVVVRENPPFLLRVEYCPEYQDPDDMDSFEQIRSVCFEGFSAHEESGKLQFARPRYRYNLIAAVRQNTRHTPAFVRLWNAYGNEIKPPSSVNLSYCTDDWDFRKTGRRYMLYYGAAPMDLIPRASQPDSRPVAKTETPLEYFARNASRLRETLFRSPELRNEPFHTPEPQQASTRGEGRKRSPPYSPPQQRQQKRPRQHPGNDHLSDNDSEHRNTSHG